MSGLQLVAMPKITASEFVKAKGAFRVDLAAAKADLEFVRKLKAAGLKLEDLDKLDLSEHDGRIEGDRELRSLFYLFKSKQRDGDRQSLTISGLGPPATPLKAVWDEFEGRYQPSLKSRALWPAVGPAARARFALGASVGPGKPNAPADVRVLQRRLKELGFEVAVNGQLNRETENAIRSYRSSVLGTDFTSDEAACIELNDAIDHALSSAAPPRWEKMPAEGLGFVNDDTDGYSFGADEAKTALLEIGASYARHHLTAHPAAMRLSLNDVSTRNGGPNRDHETHQNGLDLDFRLPRKDGVAGTAVNHADYDREAAWAMLQAMAQSQRVERVLFSDPELLARVKRTQPEWAYKVFDGGPVHTNHIHIDVKPPVVWPQVD